jgi:hypothetical protein
MENRYQHFLLFPQMTEEHEFTNGTEPLFENIDGAQAITEIESLCIK